ncbi:hypothetical protein MGG_17485 [Pyricularia oryzae 70-15]|uniref:Uncharacterized protein n=1 Tax=Pyricularia oryzae (strain 70-15 / ATCC MYA-4617 / FGSC 8958) TaxID=242507 RepID=G4NDB3_PYRO7|nr:uncharacterized protein MGG_17485 [Pyricularia oryzae 70-15]EHA49251.1 hypothetical protein MGG_17485 [Pyricularia oryzae 70-15]
MPCVGWADVAKSCRERSVLHCLATQHVPKNTRGGGGRAPEDGHAGHNDRWAKDERHMHNTSCTESQSSPAASCKSARPSAW